MAAVEIEGMRRFSYTGSMAHPQRIQSLDIWALTRSGAMLDGEHPVAELSRLQSACSGPATSPVRWQLQGLLKPGPEGRDQPWVVLRVEAELPLSCVRCLQTVTHVFRLEREFRFVADEATAMAEDEDSEEDLLPLTPPLDGLNLIEDELLMDMPILPKHENCQSEYLQTTDADAADAKPNPFAALAQLRKSSASGS
jgi:uncharacterized protein